MRNLLLALLTIIASNNLFAQSFIKVEVLNGASSTTCTDANSGPDNLWGVNIGGEGFEYYAPEGFCQLSTPNLQYDVSFPCGATLQDSIEVCFRAMEFDGFTYCLVNGECIETICKNFAVPKMDKTFHTLELPTGGSSEGMIEFSISGFEAYTPEYDDICNAIDFGIVNIGDTLGDANLGIYHNHCTNNIGEIDTYPLTGWFNNNGIWITFTTGNEETPYLDIIMKSDPQNLGDAVSFQMASFFSDNDACDGNLDYFVQYFDVSDYDETMVLNCIPPNTTFYILVDGVADDPETLQGLFGLSIEAYDSKVAADNKCDAEDFGQIPEGGELATTEIQVNRCANASGEPSVPIFSSERTVWYTFISPSSGNVLVEAFTDTLKEPIDLELAIFSSSNDACSGIFNYEKGAYNPDSFDEVLAGNCLEPNKRYWLMVDGQTDNVKGAFTLRISDAGPIQTFFQVDGFICSGDSYLVGNSNYQNSGLYLDTFYLANGCDSIIETNLTVYDSLSFESVELQEASALGINNASVLINASGGSGNLSILWDNGATAFQLDDLIGGDTICFDIFDDFGCSFTDCIVAPFNDDIIPNISLQNVDCYGNDTGVIGLSASNGAFPYSVTLIQPNGDTLFSTIPFDNIGIEFLDLFAGTYNCTISDINGAINFDIELPQNDSLSYTIINEQAISCYGFCDGLIEVEVAGGVMPYFYAWDTGGNQAEESGLCAGISELTVTDVLGCLNVFDIEVTQPDSIDGFISVITDVNCKGDTSGVLEYLTNDNTLDFLWSNDSITALNDELPAGIYTITVSDQFGCSKVLEETIEEPAFNLTGEIILSQPIKCFGDSNGALNAIILGGNGGYSFDWNSGQANAFIDNLSEGLFELEVIDEKGCSIDLSYDLTQPDPLLGDFSKMNVQCSDTEFGGSIILNYISGGTGQVDYSVDGFFFQEENEFKFLAPGVYNVIMRDSFNCEWTDVIEITSPDEISVTLNTINSIELGDNLNAEISLSNPNLVPEWYIDGELYDCSNCTSIQLEPLEDVSILVIATDTTSNCEARDSKVVEVKENLDIFFPNVFSPNGDSFNEKFYPFRTKNTKLVKEFSVFDRYGQLLYTASNFEPGIESYGWDGKVNNRPLNPGVYTFFATIEFINGDEVIFKGAITLVR